VRLLTQDLRSGNVRLVEAPAPTKPSQGVLVRTVASLVSSGTERMLADFGRANLIDKARQQPDRVRDVLDKARAEGVMETVDAVRSKLAQPLPLGYANAGIVLAIRRDVVDLAPGDLVATNGPHAEVVDVPATMAARVPDGVPAEHACFASVTAVGLEALRLARCELGERVVVTGLGLVGLLTVQLLRAQGCEVLGVDPDPDRRVRAESLGAQTSEPGEAAEVLAAQSSRGRGVDAVVICASTKSSDPVRSAARMCRIRGRIVLVGVTGLELERSELYDKELSFQVSRSYGPGRHDPSYESGHDYPFGLVRWTAGRNMEAVLDLMGSGGIDVGSLITHRYGFDDASSAYTTLVEDKAALGIVLQYPEQPAVASSVTTVARGAVGATTSTAGGIAVIGAGNFATRTLLPAIAAAGGTVSVVASPGGVSAGLAADRIGAAASSDVEAVLADPSLGAVFIATRHDSHARLAVEARQHGKAVYVEKPLAVDDEQLDLVIDALSSPGPVFTVGFNRRFAPITKRMVALLASTSGPKTVAITVNAGSIPAGHWTHDPEVGGGRILGEGCHFIDLARFLVGSPIADVSSRFLGGGATADTATISLGFEDGSVATLNYVATGSPRFPKERVEVFVQGRVLVNDNFKTLRSYGWPGTRTMRLRKQDKGHAASVAAFLAATRGGPTPIPLNELVEVSRAAIVAGRRAP
jgi:predicted dehydrogenase